MPKRAYSDEAKKKRYATSAAWRKRNRERCNEKLRIYRLQNPEKRSEETRRYREKYGPRIKAFKQEYQRRAPDKVYETQLKIKFGITLAEYNAMLLTQGGVCAIPGCGRSKSPNGRRLSVDHDHKTGKIRGLLCSHCNFVLGFAEDRPEKLDSIASWLREKLRGL